MSFLLISITLVPYWQVINSDFINFDDPALVYENPYVKKGLSWEGLQWASSADLISDSPHSDFWIPATLLSHLVTSQIFGMNPSGHHLVNLVLHLLNTLLLFLILHRMTGGLLPSAFVAVLFAVHPLHVESVAWVTERKDVLSGFFFFLTLLSYVRYVERPNLNRYLLIVLTFTLGLMSKPMLVTLPFVLLLLDYWPLNRISLSILEKPGGLKVLWQLTWEKFPLLLLTIAFSFTTYLTTGRTDAVASWERLPLWTRLANALDSYATYIHKMIWPTDLAFFYPYLDETIAGWETIAWIFLFVILTSVMVWKIRLHPYLAIGWFWYFGMLVPVIGLLQAGSQRMADRYTYLPLIGLFIMIAWGIPDLLGRLPYRKVLLTTSAGLVLLVLMVFSSIQVSYWRNNITLFEHALRTTEKNYLAHTGLGIASFDKGEIEKAIGHYIKSIQIRPDYAETHYALGMALSKQGKIQESITHYIESININPDYWLPHYKLGITLSQQEDLDTAISYFYKTLDLKPNHADAHLSLGLIFTKQGKLAMGLKQFHEVLKIRPDDTKVLFNSAVVLSKQGRQQPAILHYQRVLEIQSDYPGAHNNLGNIYQAQGDLEQAITQYKMELQMHPEDIRAHNNLANSYKEAGRIEEAIKEYKIALELQPNYPKAHHNLGNTYVLKGDLEKAASEYTTATRLSPRFLEAHHNLATVNTQLGRLEEARRSYRKILEINPDDEAAQEALASLSR